MRIRELAALLRARKTSAVELVQDFFTKVREQSFGSLITQLQDSALREARQRDAELEHGMDHGPLHGIPTAPKDLFYTEGIPTTAGSLVYKDFIPSYDATVVTRLRGAGVITVGKANLHEIAYGTVSRNPHFGPVLNPRNQDRIAGGSSGGSAALVAAGYLPFSLGTDTGGSVRIPASYCGVVGLKPTYGRVSRFGVLPLSFSLDHVGVLATSVENCAITLEAVAGYDERDGTSAHRAPQSPGNFEEFSLETLRVGVPETFFFNSVDTDVETHIHRAITLAERNGARLMNVILPDMLQLNAAARVVQYAEASAVYAHVNDASLFSPSAWSLVQQGRLIAGHEYVNAQRLRTVYRRSFDELWQKIDVLVTPTTPITAPAIDQDNVSIRGNKEEVRMASTRLVRAFNYLGEPAISLPCGLDRDGLPIGLQIIAAPFEEEKLLWVARAFEQLLT